MGFEAKKLRSIETRDYELALPKMPIVERKQLLNSLEQRIWQAAQLYYNAEVSPVERPKLALVSNKFVIRVKRPDSGDLGIHKQFGRSIDTAIRTAFSEAGIGKTASFSYLSPKFEVAGSHGDVQRIFGIAGALFGYRQSELDPTCEYERGRLIFFGDDRLVLYHRILKELWGYGESGKYEHLYAPLTIAAKDAGKGPWENSTGAYFHISLPVQLHPLADHVELASKEKPWREEPGKYLWWIGTKGYTHFIFPWRSNSPQAELDRARAFADALEEHFSRKRIEVNRKEIISPRLKKRFNLK